MIGCASLFWRIGLHRRWRPTMWITALGYAFMTCLDHLPKRLMARDFVVW
jgi:hypothetical protein